MEKLPTLDMKILDILDRWPAAQAVLAAHGMDMCCGGVHPLEMAAKAHGQDPQIILSEVVAAVRAAR